MKDIKICIAYHKKSFLIKNEFYIPIQVGKSLHPEIDLGIQYDNAGDNISYKNDYYCELTALYWLWKNVKADYKGLCHYRRFFSYKYGIKYKLKNILKPLQSLRSHLFFNMPYVYYTDECKYEQDANVTLKRVNNLLDHYDIICTKKIVENRSSFWHFSIYGLEIINLIRNIIRVDYPSYYSFIAYTETPSTFHFGNMSIMKNELFDEYCTFLFGILEKVERILLADKWYIDFHKEKVFSRKLGYFGEYLTDLFIRRKKNENVKIKELYVAILK